MDSTPPDETSSGRPRVWQLVVRVPRAERRLLSRLRLLGLSPRPCDGLDGAHVVEVCGDDAEREVRALIDRHAPTADVVRLPSLPTRLDGPATAPLDFDVTDTPQPCTWCSRWHAQRCLDHRGRTVLREWHHPRCPRVLAGEDGSP